MDNKTHIVKRAIIMAAGIGQRLQPLTLKTPKPLITVNGTRMIDTIIDGLHANGIYEIYVVVGHLKEQFYEWVKDKPGIRIIENPYYDTCNNISSLYAAREYLGDCIILDGDQIICAPEILAPQFTLSGYNAVWCEGETKEWLLTLKDGVVSECSRTGGRHGWQLYSISRWTAEDGERLKNQLAQEFESGNTQIYWDDVAMFCHFDDYKLGIREMKQGDILEIDELEELIAIDQIYKDAISPER